MSPPATDTRVVKNSAFADPSAAHVQVGQISVVRPLGVAQAMLDLAGIDVALGRLEVRGTGAGGVLVDAVGSGRKAGEVDRHENAGRRLLERGLADDRPVGTDDIRSGHVGGRRDCGCDGGGECSDCDCDELHRALLISCGSRFRKTHESLQITLAFPKYKPPCRFEPRAIQESPFGIGVSPRGPLARRAYPGFEGVPPSNEGKIPSIPALPARSSQPMPTLEEPCLLEGFDSSTGA